MGACVGVHGCMNADVCVDARQQCERGCVNDCVCV